MIDWLVFSRDRACQLDALLGSLERHAWHLTRTVAVIYRASSRSFEDGYAVTRERWPWAWHVGETSFAEQVGTWLRQASDAVGFLCDDDVFYRPAPAPLELPLPLSLRLGLNCRRQHPTGLEQELPELRGIGGLELGSDLIAWDWHGADGDFGYPFSLDGHVYPRELVLELIERVGFVDPTTLEAAVVSHVLAGASFPERYYAPARSCLVSIPANRVTRNSHNPIMAGGLGVDELNRLFLDFRRIDLASMDFSRVDGAHSEVPLALVL